MTATAMIAPEVRLELEITYGDRMVKPLNTEQLTTVTKLSEAFHTSNRVDVWESAQGHIARLTIDEAFRKLGQPRITTQDLNFLHSLREHIRWLETDTGAIVVGI